MKSTMCKMDKQVTNHPEALRKISRTTAKTLNDNIACTTSQTPQTLQSKERATSALSIFSYRDMLHTAPSFLNSKLSKSVETATEKCKAQILSVATQEHREALTLRQARLSVVALVFVESCPPPQRIPNPQLWVINTIKKRSGKHPCARTTLSSTNSSEVGERDHQRSAVSCNSHVRLG